ncbi:serine/threonine-protein kinase [Corallococcus aberystwythensis]|uniref:Serine/threonine protein kinase n=1 Tax=Corallococcus aberystwythensis TaxID=2316722 RepID=A0A3A8PNX7_9BACT|nr:serine/threonine-protein kinase [Corallococcus aberystwythensis]RKH56401.1 serine/threonine protein kinase [Corallococcus aberystwythensis]
MTGELLAGRYQLEQELGRGGMATVFLARDLRLSRRVAVKVLHPGMEARFTERFRQEAEVVASLQHPNVLAVHDFGEDAVRGPFLVCEWVQGENLRELARRLAPVPPEAVALLGWELARGLEAAHARGVVHRDVKPENVLVARGGPLKLADFGIAALADGARLTSTGAVIGSLAYMAPERIDTGAWSPASDVYAVGVVLFELCAGTTPHAGEGSARLAVSVMTRDAPPLLEAAPGTPAPLGALVARCLARDARDRPADGSALVQELEAILRPWVGAPSEASRAFLQAPEASAARWREDGFQRLLGEGRALLTAGQGAQAARCLNAALALQPGAPEVLALLRSRPTRVWPGRRRGLVAGVVLAGALGSLGTWGWLSRERAGGAGTSTASPVPASPPSTGLDATVPASVPSTTAADTNAAVDASAAPLATAGLGTTADASVPPPPDTRSGTQAAAGTPARDARPDTRSKLSRAASASLAPASRTASQPQMVPEPSTPELPVRVPDAQDFATLTVVTRPWAEVFVDGQSRGYTPRLREVRLAPGAHRIRFDNPLCEPVEQVLEVAAGETVSREVSLRVRHAEVTIVAPAASRVFVDGLEVGVAPLPNPVKLTHGGHLVSARDARGNVLRQALDAVAGTRATVVLEASP